MNYAGINPCDIANGPGVRVSLFVSGCRNRCPGCFNPETWSFTYGKKFDQEAMEELLEALDKPFISGLSLLGGDPFEVENREQVLEICKRVKTEYPEKDIWCWTGYDFIEDGLIDLPVMKYIDVLVDGRFEIDKKDLRLKWRGSWNQRVIDVRDSLKSGENVLLEE